MQCIGDFVPGHRSRSPPYRFHDSETPKTGGQSDSLSTSKAVGKEQTAFAESLHDLLAQGRTAGLVVVAATKGAGANAVPELLSDFFDYRLAFRCATRVRRIACLGRDGLRMAIQRFTSTLPRPAWVYCPPGMSYHSGCVATAGRGGSA